MFVSNVVPKIALVIALGLTVVGCAKTISTAEATTGGGSTAAPQPIDTNTELRNLTHESVAVARVGGGLEGAAYDQNGHITFWRFGSGTWHRAGASEYPLQPTLGPVKPDVSGSALNGMKHAVFILTGTFTMDGSLNAIAYTATADGTWGAIKAEPGGRIGPSGQPVGKDGIGLANGFYAVHGQLETADCSGNLPMAQCGGNQRILKYWSWGGTDFTLSRTAGLTH